MLDVVWVVLNVSVIWVMNELMRSSILRGGSGARQVDLKRKALGS